jgi:outer membrane PBP1 activator LpoA protein
MKTSTLLSLSLILSLFISACATSPEQRPDNAAQVSRSNAESIQQLLIDAEASPSPLREQQQLQAASLLLQEKQAGLAEQILLSIIPSQLPATDYARLMSLMAKLYIQRGEYEQALSSIDSPQLIQTMDTLAMEQQLVLNQLRASVFALVGSHLASAQQRIYIDPLLDADAQQKNREAIWRSLMLVSIDELKQYLPTAFGEDYRGWIELALIAKDNQSDLDAQLALLNDWQARLANHPAAKKLPGGLEIIRELAENRPQKIALLLPTTGKLAHFGKAIRDGFIASLLQTQNRGGQVPALKIYDTEASDNFITLYQQAVAEGAEMVIGPLDKQRLRLLFDEVDLPVPTLALNRVENYGIPPQQLFQFGLAPQDEASQIAEIAFLDHRKNAMIIAPQGTWGDKVSLAFSQRWESLGGKVLARSTFTGQDDYSVTIKNALLLQDSEKRAQQVQSLAGEHIEFLPRRREDIDMVFLLARPQQARSIKPLLDYHYAGDLPVYATSRLYSGTLSPKKDRDINGVKFTDMPWMLETASPLRQTIDTEIPQSKQYQRMYALGIDSFQLHPRLRQLEVVPNSRVYGQTGTLKLNQRNEIERQLLLAKIKRGRATLIPFIDPTLSAKTLSEATGATDGNFTPN